MNYFVKNVVHIHYLRYLNYIFTLYTLLKIQYLDFKVKMPCVVYVTLFIFNKFAGICNESRVTYYPVNTLTQCQFS